MVRRFAILLTTLGLILTGCSQATLQATPTIKVTGVLIPYHTLTPSPITPTASIMVIIPVTPAPTPTPFLHTITDKDTMLGIAYHYGISLEDLQAANPGVDPHFLTVGKQLIIPINGEIPEILPTPTPAPVHFAPPRCYQTGEGGAWCIVAVRNDLETSVENLSAWIGLFTPQGKNIANQIAYAALNLLRPGASIPLMTYFAPPLPDEFGAQVELLSGFEVTGDDPRYLDLQVKVSEIVISTDKKQARVSGEVDFGDPTSVPSQMWALLVAYDSSGNIIGARKWESAGETGFNLTVYSLGGLIDHVEVLTEARP